MKSKLFVMTTTLVVALLLLSEISLAQGESKLSIQFTTSGTVAGYSYPSKLVVEVDGAVVAESSVKDQQEKNSVSLTVPYGLHMLTCTLWARYEGEWQPRTVANDYSFDCIYSDELKFAKKKKKLSLVFDIDQASVVAK